MNNNFAMITMLQGIALGAEVDILMASSGKESFTRDKINSYVSKATLNLMSATSDIKKSESKVNESDSKDFNTLIKEGKIDEALDSLKPEE